MRKLILSGVLLLLVLACFSYARAQDDQTPEFKMPCRQVLKLGLEKFTDAHGEATQDRSTAGEKAAYEYYVNCKRPANDELSAKLLYAGRGLGAYEAIRGQLEDAREQLNKFGGALWNLRYSEAGGGTMWGLIAAGAYAGREDFMEILIKALAASDRKSPRARRSVKASLARIERWLSSRNRKPYTDGSEPADVDERKKVYEEAMKETRDALAQLRDILRDLPDAAAERLATRMATETKNALADSP